MRIGRILICSSLDHGHDDKQLLSVLGNVEQWTDGSRWFVEDNIAVMYYDSDNQVRSNASDSSYHLPCPL